MQTFEYDDNNYKEGNVYVRLWRTDKALSVVINIVEFSF